MKTETPRQKLLRVITETEAWLFAEKHRVNKRWPKGIIENKKRSLSELKKLLLDYPE